VDNDEIRQKNNLYTCQFCYEGNINIWTKLSEPKSIEILFIVMKISFYLQFFPQKGNSKKNPKSHKKMLFITYTLMTSCFFLTDFLTGSLTVI
jgi:hypothetical protein